MGQRVGAIQAAASPYVQRRVPGTNKVGNWNTGGERPTMQRQAGQGKTAPRETDIALPDYVPDIEPVEVLDQMPSRSPQEAPQAAPTVPGTFGPRAQLNPLADPLGADPRIETLLAMIRGYGQPTYDPQGPMPRGNKPGYVENWTDLAFNPGGPIPPWLR